METSLFQQCVFEFIGTMVLLLMGNGVCAATTLNKTKAQGAGWIVITFAWGFGVMCGVFIAGPYTGAHLNPAVTLGFALVNMFPWASVLPYIAAQVLGAFVGSILAWLCYKEHYKVSMENPDNVLGCFCTMPAIRNKWNNLTCEIIATCVLMFVILALGTKGNTVSSPAGPIGLGSMGAFPVTAVIVSIGMSLGATTGYSLNPARDLSPRFAHFILPMKGKRDSDWSYSWIPIVGPLIGATIAAVAFLLVY